jgi:hypothetical protein
VAVEGWRPVEDLVRWGFAHAPVVMANEAHDGLARCVRTREVGARMIEAAHEAGVRRLASLSDVLAAHGGTAGILRDQAPPPLDGWAGVDALVVSTDNALTEDPVNEDRA